MWLIVLLRVTCTKRVTTARTVVYTLRIRPIPKEQQHQYLVTFDPVRGQDAGLQLPTVSGVNWKVCAPEKTQFHNRVVCARLRSHWPWSFRCRIMVNKLGLSRPTAHDASLAQRKSF